MKKLLVLVPLLFLPLYAGSVSKAQFINKLSSSVPAKFCEANSFFRQCYKVSAQSCQSVAKSAFNTCTRQNNSKIPSTINKQNTEQIGQMLGSCTAKKYHSKLLNKVKISNKKCQNANNWR